MFRPFSFARLKYRYALIGLLVMASIISIIMEKFHARVNGRDIYDNLIFNLFLAWIPFIAAILAYISKQYRFSLYLIMPLCILLWLIFFPNAPYLLTDFQHLRTDIGEAPIWFDVLLMVWFAWTGLLLGVASLYIMQEIITDLFNRQIGWIFAIGATVMSSIGIFLGRFLRWNSWDLLSDPIPIARDVASIMRHPISNLPTYFFTIFFTLLFLFIYLTIHAFAGIIRENSRNKTINQ